MTTPLVLLHGVTMSGAVWDPLLPELTPHHEVRALTELGHNGGPRVSSHPVRFADIADDIERQFDVLGWDAPHIAGNSLGGWLGIEMARRGRAASVCAIAPGGFWAPGARGRVKALEDAARLAGITRLFAPLFLGIPLVRRLSFAGVAEHGERQTPAQARRATTDLLSCTVLTELLSSDESVTLLDPVPCPIHVAWCEHDKLFPPARYGDRVAEFVPGATSEVLPDVGHVPMIDDPSLVARTILKVTQGALRGA